MNLFILGTGFDSAHNIAGRYEHFKEYIRGCKSPDFIEPDVDNYSINGFRVYSPEDSFNVMQFIIENSGKDKKWSDFEARLAKLDFSCILKSSMDSNEDEEYIREYNSEILKHFVDTAEILKEYFAKWIREITISGEKKPSFEVLLNHNDIYLDFNYTHTLEQLYGVKDNVFHIHGTIDEEIIVGHGEIPKEDEAFEALYPGSSVALAEIKARLRKPTEKVLKSERMKDFLRTLNENPIDYIYSYGFGYSDVDMVYMKEICKRVKSECTWIFNDHNCPKEIEEFKQKLIEQCGYKGTFDTFHVD